ncbi:hypothetical protein D3C77_119690 [compost metagenome]
MQWEVVMTEPIGFRVSGVASVAPVASEVGGVGLGGTQVLSRKSVADSAGPPLEKLQVLPGLPLRRRDAEAMDRQRNEQIRKLNLQEGKVKPVEQSHALNALLVQVSRGQFENLSQLKTHLDSMALGAKHQMAAELDQALQQLPQQDDNAIKLGLRLNQMLGHIGPGEGATVKALDLAYSDDQKRTSSIREMFVYICSKYPDIPLPSAVGRVMKEFNARLGSFNLMRDQHTHPDDYANYRDALAGLFTTRVIMHLALDTLALVKEGANDGVRSF